MRSFQTAAAVLPVALRSQAMAWDSPQLVQEIRLRMGRVPTFLTGRGEVPFSAQRVTAEDIHRVIEIATRASAHSYQADICRGFIPLERGCRLGLCGEAVTENGQIRNLRNFSSLSIRIARQIPDAGDAAIRQLLGEPFQSTLILSPPGGGKTTFLRQLVKGLSDGGYRVSLCDERGEIAACRDGLSTFDVGRSTDILSYCPKAEAVLMLLRAMNPRILALDEITDPADAAAMGYAANCGVGLIATLHCSGTEALPHKATVAGLVREGIFTRAVVIGYQNGQRSYEVKKLD